MATPYDFTVPPIAEVKELYERFTSGEALDLGTASIGLWTAGWIVGWLDQKKDIDPPNVYGESPEWRELFEQSHRLVLAIDGQESPAYAESLGVPDWVLRVLAEKLIALLINRVSNVDLQQLEIKLREWLNGILGS